MGSNGVVARLLRGIADIVYPRRCAGCRGDVADAPGHVCPDCMLGLTVVEPPYCGRCGDPAEGRIEHAYTCAWCLSVKPAFERARSAVRYRGAIQPILHEFKYGRGTHLGRDLGALLEPCVRAHFRDAEIDVVSSVPLHATKERERSYNQSAILARDLARRLGKPLARRAAVRVRPTATQTHLTAAERRANMRGAFEARSPEWIEGRRILLVDDVMTTGATVDECSRALMAGGAAAVHVVTVARG
jgi:ComF family protein